MEATAPGLVHRALPSWAPGRRPDTVLVYFAIRGDQRAFAALFDRHHRDLLSFCRHLLGNREDAEDAVQQTFVQAWAALKRGTSPPAPRPWLFVIARNLCLDVLRSRRPSRVLLDEDARLAGVAEQAQVRDDLRSLLLDVERLPERQRSALLLGEIGGLSHQEIAEVLVCRPVQVRALVFQAREALMHEREAREADCGQIRAELANLRGGALLRSRLRRHVRRCDGCRAFGAEVRAQRRQLAVALPIASSAGLREHTLGAVFGGTAGGAGGAVGGGPGAVGSLLAKVGAAKATLAIGAAVGTVALGVGVGGVLHRGPGTQRGEGMPRVTRSVRVGVGVGARGPASAGGLPGTTPSASGRLPTATPGRDGDARTPATGGSPGRPQTGASAAGGSPSPSTAAGGRDVHGRQGANSRSSSGTIHRSAAPGQVQHAARGGGSEAGRGPSAHHSPPRRAQAGGPSAPPARADAPPRGTGTPASPPPHGRGR